MKMFIIPPIEEVKTRFFTRKNSPINIVECSDFNKSVYKDREGDVIPAITFNRGNNTWYFKNEKQRDECYDKFIEKFGIEL